MKTQSAVTFQPASLASVSQASRAMEKSTVQTSMSVPDRDRVASTLCVKTLLETIRVTVYRDSRGTLTTDASMSTSVHIPMPVARAQFAQILKVVIAATALKDLMATLGRQAVWITTNVRVRLADEMPIVQTMSALSGAIVPKDMLVMQ